MIISERLKEAGYELIEEDAGNIKIIRQNSIVVAILKNQNTTWIINHKYAVCCMKDSIEITILGDKNPVVYAIVQQPCLIFIDGKIYEKDDNELPIQLEPAAPSAVKLYNCIA